MRININQAAYDKADAGDNFEPLPDGKYKVVIEDAEVKENKAKNGSYISLKLKVVDGKFKGRMVFDIVNIANPNQKAVDIGLATLKRIAQSIGLSGMPTDTNQLLGKPLQATMKIERSEQYGDKNKIVRYRACESLKPASAPAPAAPAQQADGEDEPW